jgi:predicted secreted hydrolase
MKRQYQPISFPKDELTHDSIVEWWYFNGNLEDENGNRYSYMNCLFKTNPRKINLPFVKGIPLKDYYFSHHLVSDVKNKKFDSFIHPIILISRDSFIKDDLFINYTTLPVTKYVNFCIEAIDNFKYRVKTDSFDFIMTSVKEPLLADSTGFLNSGTDYENYYYSLTDLKTEGTIYINGSQIKVKGKSWMDHQWADVPYEKKVKWNWFSLQLDNDTQIMCYELTLKDRKKYLANLIDKAGKCKYTEDVIIKPLGKVWTSEKTGAGYPLWWNIRIPSWKIDLETKPLIENQEMIFSIINYWEGPIDVSGKMSNQDISGGGFMELVGYPIKRAWIIQYEKEFRNMFLDKIKHLIEKI